jgi:hypothetical protein
MPVHDWFSDYIVTVLDALRNPHLPADPGDVFWTVLEQAFIRYGVKHGAASRALFAVAESPPPYPDRIRTALIETARTFQSQSDREAAAPGGAPPDRDAAREASLGCSECGGEGLTSRYFWLSRRERYVSVGCTCHLCAHGAWIAQSWRSRADNRFVILADHPALWDTSRKYGPPGEAAPDDDTPTTIQEQIERRRGRPTAKSMHM